MKKLIFILFLFPSLIFGQCSNLSENQLIGLKIKFHCWFELIKNGEIVSNECSELSGKVGEWSVNKENQLVLKYAWNYGYYSNHSTYNVNLENVYKDKKMKYLKHSSYYNFSEELCSWWKSNDDNTGRFCFEFNGKPSMFKAVTYYCYINEYINEKIKDWETQGEFEKTIKFKERVNEISRKEKKTELKKEAVNYYRKSIIDGIVYDDISLGKYNPDNETFLINIEMFESINFPVPISKAENFKKNFDPSNFSNLDFIYAQDEFIVSKIDFDGFSYDLFSQE